MAQFTELLATAIANADSCRARGVPSSVVAAADETRRRIGATVRRAQQRLVSLALELRAAESGVPRIDRARAQLPRPPRG
jgi:hypothetical protein